MHFSGQRGIALVAAVMLIVFASVAVLGIVVFIAQRFRQYSVEEVFSKTIYLAQAGLNYSVYQYRANSQLFSGQVNLDASNYFVVSTTSGAQASSAIVVDATDAYLGANNRRLLGVTVGNSSAVPITIDRMIVTWSISNRTMSQIRINGSTVWSGSATSSPANVDITNTTIPAYTTYPIDLIQFNSTMFAAIITLQFVMTDSTTTSACTAYPRQGSVCTQNNTLAIKSMGKITGSNIYRTIQAIYDVVTGKVSSYSEINVTVP